MATTKIWPVKDSLKRLVDYASNPDKTTDDDLAAVIKYAMNGDKTAGVNEKACYVTGVNCIAETALEEMLSVQNHFGKTGGNVAYHCYQSFKPGEVTPEQCHRLGVELARRMWGDKYQVLVATHLDRDHPDYLMRSASRMDCQLLKNRRVKRPASCILPRRMVSPLSTI